jgi:hypothetical protein
VRDITWNTEHITRSESLWDRLRGRQNVDTLPELKQMGYPSIINLRLASEPGAESWTGIDELRAQGVRA